MQLPSFGALRGRRAAFAAATALTLAGGAATYVALPAGAAVPVTFANQTYPSTLAAPSADKQQSKVWRGDNAWWAVMISTAKGVPTIHELRTNHTWRDTGVVIDTRADSTADVWYASNALNVVSRTATGNITYTRFAYTSATRTYTKVTGFPKTVATGGTESASLAKDSTGTIWVTFTQGSRVYYAKSSGTNDLVWSAKTLLPVADNTVAPDDVSAIVAFKGKVGIGWSDQQSNAFRFAIHTDGAAAGTWSVETPLSGAGMVDDHVNLKAVGGDTRVFAAVKTSQDAAGAGDTAPLVYVLRRNADGTWVKAIGAAVGDKATRPQLMLDRESSRVYLFESGPATGGTIYYKSSPFLGLKFARGRGAPFITPPLGATINDVSTAKGSTTSAVDALAIAVDTTGKRYYHGELPVAAADTQAPISQTQINSADAGGGTITTTWPLATDDRGIASYEVFQNNVKVATIAVTAANENNRTWTYTSGVLPAGTYRFAVVAKDAAGNSAIKRTASQVVLS
ncbi:hypothetical protein [Kineosporia sp. A_224]|uniref:hypothetical protein n=1 Tax=Kineosporia sp. A_224 TaxID=1962180 RepID=UPI000B4B18A7|nr:hypothetical protein [Kineosporia sp. A_224]